MAQHIPGQAGQMPYSSAVGQSQLAHMYQTAPQVGASAAGALQTSQVASPAMPGAAAAGYQPQALQQLQYQHLQQQHQQQLQSFWAQQMREVEQVNDFKNHQLPLARIKKIMKADEDVRMISAEAPVVFSKACEMFILELTLRSWIHTEENKRRTLQKNDIAGAITRTDIFDFLVDIVPRDELREEGGVVGAVAGIGGGPGVAAAAAATAASAMAGMPRQTVGLPGVSDLPYGGMYYMQPSPNALASRMQQPMGTAAAHQMMVGRPPMPLDTSMYASRPNAGAMAYMPQGMPGMWQSQQGMPPSGSMPSQQ